MKKKIHISIPEPCHEDWQEMTAAEQGRFCGSCQKTVVDFSAMTDTQVLNYFTKASGRVCGRFQEKQVNKTYQPLPMVTTPNWLKAGALASGLLVAGVAQGQQHQFIGKVAITQPIEEMGIVLLEETPTPKPEKIILEGEVIDEAGEILIGASVLIRAAEIETVTDMDGRYTIEISNTILEQKKCILEVYYPGYNTQIKNLSSTSLLKNTVNFVLKEELYSDMMIAGMVVMRTPEEKTLWQETKDFIQHLKYKIEQKTVAFSPKEEPVENVEAAIETPVIISTESTTSNIAALHIFPNPFVEQLFVTYQSEEEQIVEIRLVDETGKIVFRQEKSTIKGENTIELKPNLSMGNYWLQLDNGKDEPLVQSVVHLKRA